MSTEFMKVYGGYNFTQSAIKTGNYTLTTSDELITLTSTGTLTLPQISTLSTSGKANKIYYMLISGASVTGTFSCNAADTINGSGTTIATATNGAYIVLEADKANNDWRLVNIAPRLETANYQDSSVTTEKIAADAIDGTRIADDSIDSEHYVDGSIDTAHIAALQVTTAKIALDAIDGTLIADDSVDSEHYVDGSIDTAHIADAQITGAKTTLTKFYPVIVADTSGTDPVTVVTAPVAMTVKSVTAIAQDTNAGNMVLKNGTDTVATFAKSTTAGDVTGEEGALTNAAVSASTAVTIESSTTNGDGRVHVLFEVTA
jgi:hypothetical protein